MTNLTDSQLLKLATDAYNDNPDYSTTENDTSSFLDKTASFIQVYKFDYPAYYDVSNPAKSKIVFSGSLDQIDERVSYAKRAGDYIDEQNIFYPLYGIIGENTNSNAVFTTLGYAMGVEAPHLGGIKPGLGLNLIPMAAWLDESLDLTIKKDQGYEKLPYYIGDIDENSLQRALDQNNGLSLEQNAENWFESSLGAIRDVGIALKDVIVKTASSTLSFLSNPITKIGSWVSNIFTDGKSEQIPDLSQVDKPLLEVNINTSPDSNNAAADPSSFVDGTVKSGGDYSIDMPSGLLNEDGLNNQEMSKITSDQLRPGAHTLTENDTSSFLDKTANFLQEKLFQPVADLGGDIWSGIKSGYASLTNLFTKAPEVQTMTDFNLDLI